MIFTTSAVNGFTSIVALELHLPWSSITGMAFDYQSSTVDIYFMPVLEYFGFGEERENVVDCLRP